MRPLLQPSLARVKRVTGPGVPGFDRRRASGTLDEMACEDLEASLPPQIGGIVPAPASKGIVPTPPSARNRNGVVQGNFQGLEIDVSTSGSVRITFER